MNQNAIAIVGAGLRFPGGAIDVNTYWNNLLNGVDAISEVQPDRWNIEAHYCPGGEKQRSKSKTKWGGFVDDIAGFDAAFFGVSPREAETLDPQQRMLLEVCWNAFEDAGLTQSRLSKGQTGVYIGGFTLDYMVQQLNGLDLNSIEPHTATGSMMTLLANRLSYVFGLEGPSLSVDTACSSSLVATHLACVSLLSGESDIALAGGVNALLIPSYFVAESQAGMLSPTGRSRTFDSRADGYVRGEGAGIVVLKRLADAIEDGDRIYATIQASGVNHDGNSENLTVPSGSAQTKLMRQVYAKAGINPQQITFIEAHGTGTPVGDPIEANAVGAVVGAGRSADDFCYIGSVKTNIGHTEAAAGVAGLIKAALCIYHRQLPPHLHLAEVNAAIDLKRLALRIPTQVVPINKPPQAILAGVNSFGFGGTNAHVLLRGWAPEVTLSLVPSVDEPPCAPRLLPISARSTAALVQFAERLGDQFAGLSVPDALLHSLAMRRDHHPIRAAISGHSAEQLATNLRDFAANAAAAPLMTSPVRGAGGAKKIAWVFTGMGPQWWGMGRELYAQVPLFQRIIDELCTEFDKHAQADGWSLKTELFADEADSNMQVSNIAQVANFALQIALCVLWRSWGVEPDCVVGHSAGEPAAAWCCGALSFTDAVLVTYHRSRLQKLTAGAGKMMAVDVSLDVAERLIELIAPTELSVAAINSANSLTIAGSNAAIDALAEHLEGSEVFAKVLRVDIPYHSHVMEDIQQPLLEVLAGITPRENQIPLYSTVTGALMDGRQLDAAYWYKNVRQPVLFHTAVNTMCAQAVECFLEIGPHSVLAGAVQDTLATRGVNNPEAYLAYSLNRKKPELQSLFENLGKIYGLGFDLNWHAINGNEQSEAGAAVFTPFAQYPWAHQRFWCEPPKVQAARVLKNTHPLLSQRIEAIAPTWEVDVFNAGLLYLKQHQIQGSVVFPGAGYIEMFLRAAKELYGPQAQVEIAQVQFNKAIYLHADTPTIIQLVFDATSGQFTIASHAYAQHSEENTQHWEVNASAKVHLRHATPAVPVDLAAIRARCSAVFEAPQVYRQLRRFGLEYGPLFQGLGEVSQGPEEVLIRLALKPEIGQTQSQYQLHPVLGDQCLQAIAATLPLADDRSDTVYLPIGIGQIQVLGDVTQACFIHSQITRQDKSGLCCDITLLDAEGRALVRFAQAEARAVGGGSHTLKAQTLYQLNWQPEADSTSTINTPTPVSNADQQPGSWVIFGNGDSAEAALHRRFTQDGETVFLVHRSQELVMFEHGCALNPADKQHLVRLFARVAAETAGALKGVIYLWGCALADADAAGNAAEHLDLLTTTPTYLIQAIAGQSWPVHTPKLWCVTHLAQAVAGSISCPLGAALWGLGRVAGQVEHPEIWGGLVDLDYHALADWALLYDAVHRPGREDQMAFRRGQRWLPQLQPSAVQGQACAPSFRADVSYLITGGLGALGLLTAQWLVEHGARHLVLIGRTPLPPRSQWQSQAQLHPNGKIAALLKLERQGCHITVAALDVADKAALSACVAEYEGQAKPPIYGVYHTAGVAIPELIINLTPDNFAQVLPAKIQGALNLHAVLSDRALDVFVLYSSLASVVTSSGQGSYSAANAFLDSFAQWRQQQGLAGLSINWGPWREAGLAAELNLVDFFASRGFFAMSNQQGMAALNTLSLSGEAQAVVLAADWHTAVQVGYPGGLAPCHLETVLEADVHSAAQENGDQGNSFLLDYISLNASAEQAVSTAAKQALVAQRLIDAVAQVLRITPEGITSTLSFAALGLDSMLALDLRNRVQSSLVVSIAVVDLLNNRPIAELAEKLVLQLDAHIAALSDEDELVEGDTEDAALAPPFLPGGPALLLGASALLLGESALLLAEQPSSNPSQMARPLATAEA
ncbi:MAG: hypothetical protein RL497_1106 [Pseudomonadota bacterium]